MPLLKGCIALLVSFMCVNLSLAINEAYYGNQLAWNQAQTLTVRIVDRMEQTDGWYAGMPIAIFGGFTSEISENYPVTSSMIRCSNMPFMWEGQTQLGWTKFLRLYSGLDYVACDGETYNRLYGSDELSDMPIFPAKDSVQVVDGVMVVKLSNQ